MDNQRLYLTAPHNDYIKIFAYKDNSDNPIDVNYDEWRYPLMWWMWAHFGNYQQLKKAAFQTGKNYYYHKKGAK